MLKKMRWRVILYAMIAFFVVIALIALLVNVVNYFIVTGHADQTLSYIQRFEEKEPVPAGSMGPPPGPFMALPDLEATI